MTADELADRVGRAFAAQTGSPPAGIWFAPGRVNLIGEHTDYNDGYVLPLALPYGTVVAAAPLPDPRIRLRSLRESAPRDIDLTTLAPGSVPGWAAYPAGVAWSLLEAGHPVGGAEVVLDGDLPMGSGLSSSASLECAVGLALADLAGADLDATALALLAQHAENDFVGMPCGVMDQMAAMHGREGHLVYLDTRTLDVEPVPFDLGRWGLQLVVVDTRAPHRLVDSEYADRRRACRHAADLLGMAALRDVTDLDAALARLPDDVLRRRVRHVVTENQRVLDLVGPLRAGQDPRTVAPLLTASHESLRDDYEVTVPELDVAVDAALAAGAYGARMTGAGFGGCVIALVESSAVEAVEVAVARAFDERGFAAPAAFEALPSGGARRLV
jgi:galactokinase